jgi:outer membrane protein assembly factor BamB
MSHDFVTELRLQLREAALREERRGPLRRGLAGFPRPAAAAALAAALIAVVVVIGGLRWGGEENRQAAPRVVATFTLADSLAWITPGFGAVWVADPAQERILRVDPRTRRVRASIPVGEQPVVNTGAGAVWALADGHVLRIDPGTNRVTARAKLASTVPLIDVLILRGAPWVLTRERVLRLDPATGRVAGSISVPGGDPRFVLAADDGIWILTRDARLLRLDLRTGHQTAEMPVRLPDAHAAVPTPQGPLLLTRDGQIARASLADGRLLWRRKVATEFGTLPVLAGDMFYIHAVGGETGRDRLLALELESGETRSVTTLPEFGATSAARVGRELWITTPGGKVMVLR